MRVGWDTPRRRRSDNGFDTGEGIGVDAAGSVYAAGWTTSSDFPTTPDALDTTHGGPPASDAFVVKLNGTGSALAYATFLGGGLGDTGAGIAVDTAGGIYVTGDTWSGDFPTTAGAFDPVHNSPGTRPDAFVAKFGEAPTAVSTTGLGRIRIQQGSPQATIGGRGAVALAVSAAGAAAPTGAFVYQDPNAGVRIETTSFGQLVIGAGPCGPGTHATAPGVARVRRGGVTTNEPLRVDVDDCAAPGVPGTPPDRLALRTGGGYAASGPVVAGDLDVTP